MCCAAVVTTTVLLHKKWLAYRAQTLLHSPQQRPECVPQIRILKGKYPVLSVIHRGSPSLYPHESCIYVTYPGLVGHQEP